MNNDILNPSYPSYLPDREDGTDRVFRNVSIQNSDAVELPIRKHTKKSIMMPMNMEHWWNATDRRKPKYLERNLSQHKSEMGLSSPFHVTAF
jgi:hypothetical protein